MNCRANALVLAALLGGAGVPAALAQGAAGATEGLNAVAAKSLNWIDADVPGFAPGMKMAVVQGNPEEAGPYTMRLSFPDGYQFPAHWHPMAENVTVLSGVLQLAMGERPDASKLKAYGPGDYLHIPAKHPHFGGAQGYTVIQLHGQGPFAINLVQKATM